MHQFRFTFNNSKSKVRQVADTIERDIDKGLLLRNHQLPSINEFSTTYQVARDTIEKAYGILRSKGCIASMPGKGYFVVGKEDTRLRVLLVFNKLSTYKKIVYDSFIQTLGNKAKVDLQVHHYDPRILKEIIESNLGQYHYYVIMPHFFLHTSQQEYRKVISLIPGNELVILDKQVKGLQKDSISVYQDFQQDIYTALVSAQDLLSKYTTIVIILSKEGNHPREIIKGAEVFCKAFDKNLQVITSAAEIQLQKGTVYIETTEEDLAILIKKSRVNGWTPGKDIGIISFNETILKELLDITVITTDFEAMGITAANCILENKPTQVSNPFFMIRRASL